MLDVIMEAVEGPMKSELLQNPSFWANQVREVLESSDELELVDILKTKDPHCNPLLTGPPLTNRPAKSVSASSDGGSSSYSAEGNKSVGTARNPEQENADKEAGESMEEFLPVWATLKFFLSRDFWRHQLLKALMHPGQANGRRVG